MYARKIGGRTITLSVSGLLWNRSLVMQDAETGSLWSHILGQAMQGPFKGKQLNQIPSVMTDWNTWRKKYPTSTVVLLNRTSREYTRHFYSRPEKFVLGIVAGDGTGHAWGFDWLLAHPVANDRLGDREVLVTFDRGSMTPRLFDRQLEDKTLIFLIKEGKITDMQTGSQWDPVLGKALAGPLAGKFLVPLPAVVSFREVWRQFHPQTKIRHATP